MTNQKRGLFDWLRGDNTQEGYEKGFGDGNSGNPARPADYRNIRPVNFVVGFDNAAQTYSEGYRTGYPDGIRKQKQLYGTNVQGDTAMSSSDSYRRQIQIINHLRSQLSALGKYIQSISNNYDQQIKKSAATGFMEEYTNGLHERFREYEQKIEELHQQIMRSETLLSDHEEKINFLIPKN